jgi:hypothetical protein
MMSDVWDKRLSPAQSLVLLVCADNASEAGHCFASPNYIAWRTGFTLEKVNSVLNGLARAGVVTKTSYGMRIDLANVPDKSPAPDVSERTR